MAVMSLALVTSGAPLVAGVARGQTMSSSQLIPALKQGGYVLVMRHGSSPREPPTRDTANPDNSKLERQLDEPGRAGAIAMGNALRDLKIPVGEVLTSPTYRALETVKFARLENATPVPELGDGGQSMQGVADAQGAWLRERVAQRPASTNTVIVTHLPNLSRAFPAWGSTVSEGETVIVRPDGNGGSTVVGRIKIDEWSKLHFGSSNQDWFGPLID
jgi:phosphohistidine phosphatase SixA